MFMNQQVEREVRVSIRLVDIYAVKELLGHQDIRTGMVYAKSDTETLQCAVDVLKN